MECVPCNPFPPWHSPNGSKRGRWREKWRPSELGPASAIARSPICPRLWLRRPFNCCIAQNAPCLSPTQRGSPGPGTTRWLQKRRSPSRLRLVMWTNVRSSLDALCVQARIISAVDQLPFRLVPACSSEKLFSPCAVASSQFPSIKLRLPFFASTAPGSSIAPFAQNRTKYLPFIGALRHAGCPAIYKEPH